MLIEFGRNNHTDVLKENLIILHIPKQLDKLWLCDKLKKYTFDKFNSVFSHNFQFLI